MESYITLPDLLIGDYFVLRQKNARSFYVSIEKALNDIDEFIRRVKSNKDNFLTDLEINLKCHSEDGDICAFLVKLTNDIDCLNALTCAFSNMRNDQLLFPAHVKIVPITDKLIKFINTVKSLDLVHKDVSIHVTEDFSFFSDFYLSNIEKIKNNAIKVTEALAENIGRLDYTYKDNIELMSVLLDKMFRRYKKDYKKILDAFVGNIINPEDALKELHEEGKKNDLIKMWMDNPDNYAFLKKARAIGNFIEIDLLPVLEFRAKYKRLQEMIQDNAQKRVACRTEIKDSYINNFYEQTNGKTL